MLGVQELGFQPDGGVYKKPYRVRHVICFFHEFIWKVYIRIARVYTGRTLDHNLHHNKTRIYTFYHWNGLSSSEYVITIRQVLYAA